MDNELCHNLHQVFVKTQVHSLTTSGSHLSHMASNILDQAACDQEIQTITIKSPSDEITIDTVPYSTQGDSVELALSMQIM